MPFTQGATGRDHNGGTFVTWLAGAGVEGGRHATARATSSATRPPKAKPICYDLHATILHLLGIDHTRLTFRHNGIDRRLTDVHGHVIREISGVTERKLRMRRAGSVSSLIVRGYCRRAQINKSARIQGAYAPRSPRLMK